LLVATAANHKIINTKKSNLLADHSVSKVAFTIHHM